MPIQSDSRYNQWIFRITGLISLIAYVLISYMTARYETVPLISYYLLLFAGYLFLYYNARSEHKVKQAYVMGILFRLSLILLMPNLSDDVYRFIWDGRLMAHGINPYTHPPLYYLSNPGYEEMGLTSSLFELFGKNTHSSYPPLNQLIFALSVLISPHSLFGSILVIRLFLFGFEMANLILIKKLLTIYNQPIRRGLLYFLNPLVILELTGNLHFEVLMIFFLLLSLWYFYHSRFVAAGMAMGLSILSKMIPLLFVPFTWIRSGKKYGLFLVLAAGGVVFLGFLAFLRIDSVEGFLRSLALYFYKLEFNASIYFLVRQLGYWITGMNIIYVAGPLLGFIAAILILLVSSSSYAQTRKAAEIWMWLLMIYFAFTTTLHPWYITTLLALCIFTRYRFPLVWTFLIFFTYKGYTRTGYSPNYWVIGIEYVVVYGFLLRELIRTKAFRKILRVSA
jgi:hypothetical protein